VVSNLVAFGGNPAVAVVDVSGGDVHSHVQGEGQSSTTTLITECLSMFDGIVICVVAITETTGIIDNKCSTMDTMHNPKRDCSI